MPPTERAARLLVDLLNQLHDSLLQAAIEDDQMIADASFVKKIDALLESITTVRVVGEVELSWFQADKEAALRSREQAQRLLNWVIDKVIKQKRARGFLVNQKAAGASLLLTLFDARVLHLVRKGYSAKNEPGERYDVYVIDYGAYVDLIHTKFEPQGVLPLGEDGESEGDAGYVNVPTEDLRAIRRAILDLDEFERAAPAPPA